MQTFEWIEKQTIPMHLCNSFEPLGSSEILFHIMNTPRIISFSSQSIRDKCYESQFKNMSVSLIMRDSKYYLQGASHITGDSLSDMWEIEVVDMIRAAEALSSGDLYTTIAQAKKEGWFGEVYKNYVVSYYGLANYLFELYSFQIWVLKNLSTTRPKRQFIEFSERQKGVFNGWRENEYLQEIKKLNDFDLNKIDLRHIAQIRKYSLTVNFPYSQ